LSAFSPKKNLPQKAIDLASKSKPSMRTSATSGYLSLGRILQLSRVLRRNRREFESVGILL
jgi:hypothetical protein